MKFSRAGKWTVLLAMVPVLGLCLTEFSAAQAVRQGGNRAAPQAQPANRAAGNLDQHFAACLVLENDNEVQAAKLAEQKSESSDVKKFAETMQKDHEKFIKELEKFSGNEIRARRNERGANTRENAPAKGAAPNAEREPRREAPRAGAAATAQPRNQPNVQSGNMADTFLQIKEEIADQCLASTRRELGSKSGDEFDECYMGMQIAAHMQMVIPLMVLERHASPALQQVLHDGLDTAEKHLDHAKKIMKSLKDGGERTARSSGSTEKK